MKKYPTLLILTGIDPGSKQSSTAEQLRELPIPKQLRELLKDNFEKVSLLEVVRQPRNRILSLIPAADAAWEKRKLRLAINRFIKQKHSSTCATLFYSDRPGLHSLVLSRIAENNDGCGFVTRVNASDLNLPSAAKILRKILPAADAIIADSDFTHQRITELTSGDQYSSKIHVIARGCFHPEEVETAGHHLPADRTQTFVSVGNAGARDRVDLIFRFLRQLALARPSLTVVWHHFSPADIQAPILREHKTESPANLTIKFQSIESQANIYASEPVDWFISLNDTDGVSTPMARAMSLGIPVITAIGAGIDEIIDDDNGLLLPSDPEPEEFVRGLLPYLDSLPRYQHLREGALRTWAELLDTTRHTRHLLTHLPRLQ